MPDFCRFTRVFQFTYPLFIFLSALLAWNSVGQVPEFPDFRVPPFDGRQSGRGFPRIQAICSSPERFSPSEPRSCARESSETGTPRDAIEPGDGSAPPGLDHEVTFVQPSNGRVN